MTTELSYDIFFSFAYPSLRLRNLIICFEMVI
jgi:hypothetical protein